MWPFLGKRNERRNTIREMDLVVERESGGGGGVKEVVGVEGKEVEFRYNVWEEN